MGSSQSSLAEATFKGSSSKSPVPESLRGREKSIMKSAPHGLRASVVSMPSEDLREILSDAIGVTQETHPCLKEVVMKQVEESIITDTESEEDEDEDDEDDEEEIDEFLEERKRILEDARNLRKMAAFFLHPEKKICADDPARFGRNFFTRYEAAPEEQHDRADILADCSALKASARQYFHPEEPVTAADSTCFGRNYFGRASAVEQDDSVERDAVLADCMVLKAAARQWLHPEEPIESEAAGRNYFTRYSAPEEYADERAAILADCKALSQVSRHWLHPEIPVQTTDPASYGRNYFTRFSTPELDADSDARDSVLADCLALKESAHQWMHPEQPIQTDPTVFGRNYFLRFAADDQEENATERDGILSDITALKSSARQWFHPEDPVKAKDPCAFGRNYFTRHSSPEQQNDPDLRDSVLRDASALKSSARQWMHPEDPVHGDATAFGRNFFLREAAPEHVDMDERDRVLADALALKAAARQWLHPEDPVVVTDTTACARNYFSRFGAEYDDDFSEREVVLKDCIALKSSAQHWLHPEIPVQVDSTSSARCFFDRPSAPEAEEHEESDALVQILQDSKALKAAAMQYRHPELPVVASDPTCFGRNYFLRAEAPGMDEEEAEERLRILGDAKALKMFASHYYHPELPVDGTAIDPAALGRNFFDRPGAPLHDQMIHTFPPHDDDTSSHHHEHMDHFGMDEDMHLFEDLREALPVAPKQQLKMALGSECGSNLSRSPSSIMLFGMDETA